MKLSTLTAVSLIGLAGLLTGNYAVQPSSKSAPSRSRTSFRTRRRFQAGPQSLRPSRTIARRAIRPTMSRPSPAVAKFKEDFWRAEVTKMIKVYGAPIEEADVGKIVDYLTQNY